MTNDQSPTPPVVQVPRITWWIIWLALTASVVMYFVVLKVSPTEPDAEGSWRSLHTSLMVIAAVTIVASFAIRFIGTRQLIESEGAKKRSLAFGTYIVSLALAESVAIFGLVLAFMGAPFSEYIAFFVIGGVALLAQPPTFLPAEQNQEMR